MMAAQNPVPRSSATGGGTDRQAVLEPPLQGSGAAQSMPQQGDISMDTAGGKLDLTSAYNN